MLYVLVVPEQIELLPEMAPGCARTELAVTVTVSMELGQTPLEMVQVSKFTPGPRPVTLLVGLLGVVMVPGPETTDQVPVPTDGELAARVVEGLQIVWSGPAFEVLGLSLTFTVTLAQVVVLQVPSART